MRTYSMLIAALAVAVAFGLGAGSEVVVAQAVQDVHQATVYQPPYEQTEAFTFVADGAVRELQTLPGQHGYPVAVDGDFGPQTLAAVRAFQKTKGPDVDGIVGPQTWAARRSRRRRAGARPRGSGSAAASHEQCRRRKRR